MDPESCLFCRFVRGEADVRWVARRPEASALLPLEQGRLSPAHVLVIPHEHARGIQDASPSALTAVALLTQEIARAMETVLGARGVNVLNASGPDSDQSVPHLHVHVVPRWEGDGMETWPQTVSRHPVDESWLADVAAVLDS